MSSEPTPSQPTLAPLPVYDPRVRKWRCIILMTMLDSKVSAYLPVDGWKTEQEARTAGLALMVVIQKKAQQTK